jgi:nucleoid-associated protein YgaU
MRNAREFVEEYRGKGYPDDRIRIIASMRPEPLRSEALKVLDASKAEAPGPVGETPGKDPESLALEIPDDEAVPEVEVAAIVNDDSDSLEELLALRAELADVRKEREEVAALLKRTAAEVERMRTESAEASELKTRIAELQSVHDELEETRSQRQEVTAAKAEIEGKLADFKGKVKQKETLLSEKDKILNDLQEQMLRERELREEREAEAARAESELREVQEAISSLRENEEIKLKQLARAEDVMNEARSEADSLRGQMDANEQAVSDLQEKVSARESELESLREHFDREAKDLNKRAEQELWLIQRRMRRLHRMAGVGGVVAACLLVAAAVGYAGKAGQVSKLVAERDARPIPSERVEVAHEQLPAPRTPIQPVVHETPSLAPDNRTVPLHVDSNVPPVNEVTPAPPAPAPAKTVKMYTVQKDDILWDIALKFLGRGDRWREIARDNGINERNPRIQIGQVLKITVTEKE